MIAAHVNGSYSCTEYSVVNITRNYTCTVAIRHLQGLHYSFFLFFRWYVVGAPYMIRTVPLSTGARYPPLRIILMFTYLHLAPLVFSQYFHTFSSVFAHFCMFLMGFRSRSMTFSGSLPDINCQVPFSFTVPLINNEQSLKMAERAYAIILSRKLQLFILSPA